MNNKGFSFITTLILSFVALGFIGALMFFITTGTKISGGQKRYTETLEAAKSTTEFIMARFEPGVVGGSICTGSGGCISGNNVDLTSMGISSQYNAVATILSRNDYTDAEHHCVYTIQLTVSPSYGAKERTIVDFGFIFTTSNVANACP